MQIESIWQDRIKGMLFGHAIGDALGLATEFLSKNQVNRYYPSGIRSYGEMIQDRHRAHWQPGEWTDDTDQMLCILDSLLEKKRVDVFDIARRFHYWAFHGGRGIGRTVLSVLTHDNYLNHPHQAAIEVWERSGRRIAANGALMRTSILGVWDLHDREALIRNVRDVCRITHADPRCIASCVAVCVTIRKLILCSQTLDLDRLITEALDESRLEDPGILEECSQLCFASSIETLRLDEGLNPGDENKIGYTYKALPCAMWALRNAKNLEGGLHSVIMEGGDADTNAAIAGALLGARFGYKSIPEHLISELKNAEQLHEKSEQLTELLSKNAS